MNVRLDPPADGTVNMAADLQLLNEAEAGRSGARVYSWSAVWITLGRHQSPKAGIPGVDIVPTIVRPTGGKAVLHGHDVTVAIAMSLDELGIESRSIRPIYRAVTQPLVTAMQACGLPATLAETEGAGSSGGRTGDCFAFASPNDIIARDTGRKVCGCALRITERAVLLQASIPVTTPLVDPVLIFDRPAAMEPREWRWQDLATALARQYA